MTQRNDPDRALVLRCQNPGSEVFEDAFQELYRRYREKVFHLALRITGNRSDALDAAQEAFILLYQKVGSFQFESKFSSWLYRLVTNSAIDTLRRKKKFQREEPAGGEDSTDFLASFPDQGTLDPSRSVEEEDFAIHIRRIVHALSPKLKVVIVLRYLQGLSYEEVAETLELSLGTVKSRISRAHLALAKQLEPLLARYPEFRSLLAGLPGEEPSAERSPS